MLNRTSQNLFKIILSGFFVLFAMFALFPTATIYAQPKPPTNTPKNTVPATTAPAQPTANGYSDSTKPTNGDNGGFVLCGNNASSPCTIGHLFAAFIVIINYLIAMAGFIAVAAIVYAGFMMIYSQGQDNLKAAKSRFSGAVIGLVLVAGAYVLINSLFSGRFSIGVCDDQLILANPKAYIQNYQACKGT